jgi:hypothetical protein
LQKKELDGVISNPFSKANVILITKPEKGITRKENYATISFMNIDIIILNKILTH